MQVFEFHFNPKLKSDLLFDSFYYEPENLYEKRVGSLYLVGVLKNALPQSSRFLDNLAKIIKEKYYRLTLKNPEKALKESLKEANEFLEQMVKRGDVRWLGNLSFAAISFKNNDLNFTKVGDLKIFLLRGGKVIDIDRKLKFDDIAPWPLRVFGNIVSGKLAENDVLLVLSKEIINFFEKENLLGEIARIQPFNENGLKEIFDKKKEGILKISGVCLGIVLTKEVTPASVKEVISPKSYPKEFNLKEVFSPFIKTFRQLIKKPKLGKLPKLTAPKVVIPKFSKLPKLPKLSKNLISVLALIFFLFLGFFVAQIEEKKELRAYQATLNEIREKITQAESFLILKDKPEAIKNANFLFKESWQTITPIAKVASTLPQSFANQVYALKNKISENLYQLNKLKTIEEPKILFEFNPKEFIPQKTAVSGKNLYFFSPYAQNLLQLKENGEETLILNDKKINFAANLEGAVLFFTKPNQLTILKEGEFSVTTLQEPSLSFNFNDLVSFRNNLYFLDKSSGRIIKYLYYGNSSWGIPQLWLTQEKKAVSSKSMAVDGFIWLLNRDNSISQYSGGQLKHLIKLDIFPEPKDFSKILTLPTLPYLYILEPNQSRIVIINKTTDQIVQQIQSEKFDNLLDFAISEDGKIIYILNGLEVFTLTPP